MGRKITKKEFNETVMAYAMDTVVIVDAAGESDRFQWGFQERDGINVVDQTEFKTEKQAKRGAEEYVRKNCPNQMAIGRNDAREWMKFNGHTF